jgi:predicted metal-dependent hydrolase
MQRLTLETSNGPLEYTVTRRYRLKKRLHMELDAYGGLLVVAPEHWSSRQIATTLGRNVSQVVRFLSRAPEGRLEPLQYVNGEKHLYLGRRYPLKILPASGKKTSVTITEDEICVETSLTSKRGIEAVLQSWYRKQAREIFSERLKLVSNRAAWARHRAISLKLRKMKRTWGNCSVDGVIKLNTHLIKAPVSIIDSVIAHELCHLKEMNHSKAFYTLLRELNPNWRQDRLRLRAEASTYLL